MLNILEIFGFLMNFSKFPEFICDTMLTELSSEKFVWFGPSPIEPFNQGTTRPRVTTRARAKEARARAVTQGRSPTDASRSWCAIREANELFALENEHFHDQQVPWPRSSNTFFWEFE